MKTYSVKLNGVSELCFGKHVPEKRGDNETYEQHDERTWQGKVNIDAKGQCFIQPFALKNCLESAARWLSVSIPGEGKKTFTKRFTSGVLITDRMPLTNGGGKPVTMEHVTPLKLFVPSDGKRGSGKRVFRTFPIVAEWNATCEIIVLDDKISKDVLSQHLDAAGKFIGLGSMRVENGGINGRFAVEDLKEVK